MLLLPRRGGKKMKALLKSILLIGLTVGLINIQAGSSLDRYVDFYGHTLSVSHDYYLSTFKFRQLNQQEIDQRLDGFRNTNLTRSTYKLTQHADKFELDDAARVLLVDKFANQITEAPYSNEATFIKYIILKDMGYDVVLTRTGTQLNCLGNLSFTPGRFIYIRYNNKVYKDLNFTNRENKGKHLIFKDDEITRRRIAHNPSKAPKIDAKKVEKSLDFVFKTESHELEAVSNASITEYLGDLPMYKVGSEFTALGVSPEMDATAIDYLRTQVAGRDQVESVQFLLAFVQQVVPYGSDYDKYGEERFYYPEETIMSSTADCEDKAMLLAYLCKDILNIETVGLYFEKDEHISLGIKIPDYAPSGAFSYAGETYVSCEPTAKYPRLTQSQFDLRRVTEVIPL